MVEVSIDTTYIFMVAAVSDFILDKETGKISRGNGDINLNLRENTDLIKEFKAKFPHIVTISFSAQTDNLNNFEKLRSKNSDYLVINNIKQNKFGSNENQVKVLNKDNVLLSSDVTTKNIIASEIIDLVLS